MSQIKINADQREALGEALGVLGWIGNAIDEIPLTANQRDRLKDHLSTVHQRAQDAVGVDVRGRCEGCEALLVVGDLVHGTEEGDNLCEDCAPTVGDVLRQYKEILERIDAGGIDAIVAAKEAEDVDDLRERFTLLSAYSPEDLAKKALTELT